MPDTHIPDARVKLTTVLDLIDELDLVTVQCSEMSIHGTVESVEVMISHEMAYKPVVGIEDDNGTIKIWIDSK